MNNELGHPNFIIGGVTGTFRMLPQNSYETNT